MTTAALVGQLTFRPGARMPAIGNSRMPLAGMLLRGTSAENAPTKLAGLYALCGEAHRLTSQLAVDAARGVRGHPTPQELSALAAETMREHVRRIWLDWPRLFGTHGMNEPSVQAVRGCPLFGNGRRPEAAALRNWVESELLGEQAAPWLKFWRADPVACLDTWTQNGNTMPARLLRGIAKEASELQAGSLPLLPHAEIDTLMRMARAVAADSAFEKMPTWQGKCCETGSWNRIADAARSFGPESHGAWFRLGARVAELAVLSSTGSDMPPPLALGALRVAPGEALAWSEMARGLLLHRVRLEPGRQQAVIADYRIVAPTEWNFHPRGAAAIILAQMPRAKTPEQRAEQTRRIGVLAAAFDPCISYQIEFEHA